MTPEERLIAVVGEKEAQEFFILLHAAIEEGRVEARAQARAEAIEECARAVEASTFQSADWTWNRDQIAAAIRSLPGAQPNQPKEGSHDCLRKDNPMDAVSSGSDSTPTPAQTLAADLQSTRPGRQEE